MEAVARRRAGLTKEQTTTFFTSSRQMEASKEILVQLGQEGIKKVKDFVKFSKDNWKQVTETLKCPGGQMKNLDKRRATTTLP
eukprot:4049919-Ditylum_brightwellii.AAC.1